MAGYTFASICLADADKAAAQAEFPAYFQVGASASGQAPATHWVSSGAFENDELDTIVNDANWHKRVKFGNDLQGALAAWGLQLVQAPEATPL